MGSVITFYSFKGGVGRTMALANVACMLAKWGRKVLMIDWDLEAPGLEHFFLKSNELDRVLGEAGLVELLSDLSPGTAQAAMMEAWQSRLVELKPRSDIQLSLLTAGSRSDTYFQNVRNFDVEAFYEEKKGGQILETLRSQWKDSFDFVLIDSRTGITDIGGVCTIQMPDILVLLFTATEQSLTGAVRVAAKATVERQKLPFDRSLMPVLPLPSKFDTQAEHRISRRWLGHFQESVSPLFEAWLPKGVNSREFLEFTKIPYVPFFSFGEGLPVMESGTSDPTGLGYAYETLAALLGNRLQNADLLLERRDSFVELVRAGSKLPRTDLRDIPARAVLFIQSPHGARLGGNNGETLRRYETLLVDSAARFTGTIAMSSEEGVLLGFSDVAAAIRCASSIQERLAVSKPILVDRNPLRPRIAIEAATPSLKRPPTTAALFRGAMRISYDAKAGQILISSAGVDAVGAKDLDVTFIPVREHFVFEVVPIKKIRLQPEEREALFKQNPGSKQGGGFQAFLVQLQERMPEGSDELTLTLTDRERIARYAHDYRSGGWQARLRKIFGRTLGPNLGRQEED